MNWKRLALAMAWLMRSAGVMRVAFFRTYKPVRNGQANKRMHEMAAAHDEPPLVMRGVSNDQRHSDEFRFLDDQRPRHVGARFPRNASIPSDASSSSILHAIASLVTAYAPPIGCSTCA